MTRLASRLAAALLFPALLLGLASDSSAAPPKKGGGQPIESPRSSRSKVGLTSGYTSQTSLGTADLLSPTSTTSTFSPASLDDEEEEQLRQQWGGALP